MTELVQLERRHDEFPKRNARVIAVSVEGLDDARKTQADFPHLTVVSDEARGLGGALATLAQQPFGPWLLGLVATGFVLYGLFTMIQARYRRLVIR